VPFVFSGIAVSVALTQFPRQVGRLYAADLLGAALGCVILIAALDFFGAPLSVFVAAALGFSAAGCFAVRAGAERTKLLRRTGIFAAVSILLLAAPPLVHLSIFSVTQAKGESVATPVFEKWNSYSRVAVDAPKTDKPFGWGLSEMAPQVPLEQQHLGIDGSAGTVMTRFDGKDMTHLGHLKFDVTNIVHSMRHDADVYVIGAGGGRDVLSSLVFNQHHVTAVEMNKAIIDIVNKHFGDFTGHLDANPKVTFINDEARSYLTRSDDRFDIIQISLIDTWAATAAGAFVLSENTLYTEDAWKLFMSRLKPGGVLSVSRWYDHPMPREVYRSVSLATSTLRDLGVSDTRKHIMLVSQPLTQDNSKVGQDGQIATLMVSPQPYTPEDLRQVEDAATAMHFSILLSPTHSEDVILTELADSKTLDGRLAKFTNDDLSAPDDNRPFFFKTNSMLLNGLFLFVLGLTVVFIIIPAAAKMELPLIYRDGDLTLAFAGIGVAFMLIEVSQMQRLVVLLGHPTFSLSVALFGLLVSSGIGSFTCGKMDLSKITRSSALRMAGLLAVLIVIGFVTRPAVTALAGASTGLRVVAALALLSPAGFFMGMAFPILMRIATARRPQASAWFWGINGGASICASVLAVMISTGYGISAAWWSGVACYVVAIGMMLVASRKTGAAEVPAAAEMAAARS